MSPTTREAPQALSGRLGGLSDDEKEFHVAMTATTKETGIPAMITGRPARLSDAPILHATTARRDGMWWRAACGVRVRYEPPAGPQSFRPDDPQACRDCRRIVLHRLGLPAR